MKLGVGVDINCGTKRVSNVRPAFSYTGPTGALCTGQTSRTLGLGTRITPCGDPLMSAGGKGKSVQYNKYAAAYRNCQTSLSAITTGVSPQACADGACVRACVIPPPIIVLFLLG